jgi:Outer membrane protein beta-barrel domain
MKKIAAFLFISFSAISSFSQTGKGNWLVGGIMSFNSSNEHDNISTAPDYKSSVFQIAPDFGYFFINNLAGGLDIQYSSIHSSESVNSSTSSSFSAGPFARYYFNLSNTAKIFVHGNIAWGSQKYSADAPASSVMSYGFKAGPAFFLSPHVALEIAAGYQSMKTTDTYIGNTTTGFTINAGFQVHLGPSKK